MADLWIDNEYRRWLAGLAMQAAIIAGKEEITAGEIAEYAVAQANVVLRAVKTAEKEDREDG